MKYDDIAIIANGGTLDHLQFYSFVPAYTRIAIYGAADIGTLFCRFVQRHRPDVEIVCFIDDYRVGDAQGVPIREASVLKGLQFDLVVICSRNNITIAGILKSMAIENYVNYRSSGLEEDPHTESDLMSYSRNHFCSDLDRSESVRLFKSSVKTIIFETSSYCNRVCDYCPVSTTPSRKNMTLMDDEIFERIVDDLEEIDYSNWICLNLFNEPLAAKDDLFGRLGVLRNRVKKGRPFFHTNGDYLDLTTLKMLNELGVKVISVSIHWRPGEPYDDVTALNRINKVYQKLGLDYRFFHFREKNHINSEAFFNGTRVNAFSTNYLRHGVNRGELLPDIPSPADRSSPCMKPFSHFAISYDGQIFPCCHLFPDSPKHRSDYSCGSILDYDSLFSAYSSQLFAEWRRALFLKGQKHSPCRTCDDCNTECCEVEAGLREHMYRSFAQNPAGVLVDGGQS